MDVDARDPDVGKGLPRRDRLKGQGLVDPKFGGLAAVPRKGKAGIDADPYFGGDPPRRGEALDEGDLLQAVGDEGGAFQRPLQIHGPLSRGGVVDPLRPQPAPMGLLDLGQAGGVGAQAMGEEALRHRRVGVGFQRVEKLRGPQIRFQAADGVVDAALVIEVKAVIAPGLL